MDIKFSNKETDVSFSHALAESPSLQQWLTNHITNYTHKDEKITLEIGIDHFTKGDKDSYDWAIYSQPIDSYEVVSPTAPKTIIINGGLIYRGDNKYSSHTWLMVR